MSRFRQFLKRLLPLGWGTRRRTVRTMFSFFGLVLFLAAAVAGTTQVSYIRLESTSSLIKAGDHFGIDVYANAHVPVNAVDITITFDESKVKVESVDKGQSVLTLWTEEPRVENGKVMIQGGTYRKGFIGEHKIATIELTAKETGESEFDTTEVILLAGDGKGTPVKTAEADGSHLSLFVYDEATDPSTIGVDVAVTLATDLNGDGKVTLADISSFMGAWANQTRVYDFNGDGKMSFKDFSIILADAFLKN